MLSKLKSPTLISTLLAVLVIFLGGAVVLLTRLLPEDNTWSPDGEWIAFSCGHINESNLYIMRSDGSDLQRLTSSNDSSLPTWSPDGEWIAFVKNDSLYRIRPNGRDMQRILDNSSQSGIFVKDTTPSWSQDGHWIAFRSNRSHVSEWDIYRYRIASNGDVIERLTEGMRVYRPFTWSPDGEKIVFASTQQRGLYVIELDGRQQQTISEFGTRVSDPAFSPNGEMIVFSMEHGDSIDLWINGLGHT